MSSNSSTTPPSSQGQAPFASPSIAIVLTAFVLIIFFVGFFSIFFCRGFASNVAFNFGRTPSPNVVNPPNNGLDPSLIQLFPTFTYSSVKDFRKEKHDLECAICLGDISEDDLLRLLTVCYHVFHKECIDLWLESHKTCPVCRRDLDLPKEALQKNDGISPNNTNSEALDHDISITIEEQINAVEGIEQGNDTREGRDTEAINEENGITKKEAFSRSHSTGHSILVSRGLLKENDKYTLRLPEHLMKVTRGHGATLSCIAFGEFSTPAYNGGLGEVSWFSSSGDVKIVDV